MKIAAFNDYRVGVVDGELIYDISSSLPEWRPDSPWVVRRFIASFRDIGPAIGELLTTSQPQELASVTLRAPVPDPGQLLAAPLNFQAHRDEMSGHLTAGPGTAAELGYFVKSSRSVSDPGAAVLLPPLTGRRFDFEAEIAVVVGKRAQGVGPEQAMDTIFGYTIVLDMTMRMTESGREERSMRKSFATFTPMGPWIVTSDEIEDVGDLSVRAWLNDELRQDACLKDLIVPIPSLVSKASHVLPLEPGDVYATGSPAGVGEVRPGDVVVVESPQIGRFEVSVRARTW